MLKYRDISESKMAKNKKQQKKKTSGEQMSKQKIESLKKEVSRSILLSKKDRDYWLNHAQSIPEPILTKFLKELKQNNDLMETYLKKALDEDPTLLDKMKQKIIKIKKRALELQEKDSSNKENVENYLEEEFNKL